MMTLEKSCGAIVFRKFHGNVEILLIKHANGGHWSFPKGHVEEGETEVETATREIFEETGISVMFGILTTDNIEQAISRAGSKAGNKGYDCAVGAIEMVNVMEQI